MPLEHAAPGTPGFERNIKREIAAGKPQEQAVAIAYRKSGERRADAHVDFGALRKNLDEFLREESREPEHQKDSRLDAALTAAEALHERLNLRPAARKDR